MLQMLEDIYQGRHLSFEQAKVSFSELLTGKVEVPVASALLAALKTKGESVGEIAGAAYALRKAAMPFPKTDYITSDCCGTGGDGFNTINVSTISAFVAATLGVKVVKHGNRSVSSKCGSSDLMDALGINYQLSPEKSKQLLDRANFCFLLAPQYHQGVKHVMPIRQSLKTRTIFNLIGPLANPAAPDIQLLGVYDSRYCKPFAEILNILGSKKAMVVNGSGLDEVALHDKTDIALLDNGSIETFSISPKDLGLDKHSIEDMQVDTKLDNLSAALKIMSGKGSQAHNDMIAANCGALLYLNGEAPSLKDSVRLAKDTILSGQVAEHLQLIKEVSND
ncbi:MAG: anthranilate phosphoribosyltransferase [Gammaproteobacteria bacterium]|nr:anthranilate phosphoribosyltransferase [Gammaproteobacteria bacterium]